MASPIPIKNIYYLLAYAWNRLPESDVVDVSALESQELADLFAVVLINGIHHLLRRGLSQSYVIEEAEIAGIRGRINIGVTARRMLASHSRAFCEFDELRVDILPNQILRATVFRLIRVPSLDVDLRSKLRSVYRELGGITDVPLSRRLFRSVQLHSNTRFYRFLLSICELVAMMSLVDEASGDFRFRDFIRDDNAFARLFEAFVCNFYRIERPDLDVGKQRILWQAHSTRDPDLRYLPNMETDISVRDKPHSQTLIIETKFYRETFQRFYEVEKVHSTHLYQLFTYLKNLQYEEGPDATAAGLLLYPVVRESVRLSYRLPGHDIGIATVSLGADWTEIRAELMSLVSHI